MCEHDAIYIRTAKERRPFIIEHPNTPVYSKANAHELQHWYDHGGKEAMLYYLMHEVDGNAFDPYEAAPETSGKEAMAEASRSPAEQFVHDLLGDASAGDPPQPFNLLLQSFIGDTGPYQKPIDKRMEQSLSRALGRARLPHKRVRIEGEKKTVYAVADLDMWRVAGDDEWAALKLQHPFF